MKHPRIDNSKKGFTLVELLIAISIIAILTALGFSTYQAVYKASRDSKRLSDLKFIQSGLQQYHADQKFYPFSVIPDSELSYTNAAGKKFVYLTRVPNDSVPQPDYTYVAFGTLDCKPGGSCSAVNPAGCICYCLYTRLENKGAGQVSDPVCSSPPDNRLNYGLTRP